MTTRIPYGTEAADDFTDTAKLLSVFKRQLDISIMAYQITRLLYEARAEWIGGAMAFDDLTPQQKAGYRKEVELLIKGSK